MSHAMQQSPRYRMWCSHVRQETWRNERVIGSVTSVLLCFKSFNAEAQRTQRRQSLPKDSVLK